MGPAAVAHDALTHADGIGVYDLVGAVAISGEDAQSEREGMVVGRRVAEVETEERRNRLAVRQTTSNRFGSL